MKKKVLSFILVLSIIAGGCGMADVKEYTDNLASYGKSALDEFEKKEDDSKKDTNEAVPVSTSLLGNEEEKFYDESLVPAIEPYSVAADFSNVTYEDEFKYMFFGDEESDNLRKALIKNNFAVVSRGSNEFFDIYESNRYVMFPNFITVDSLMHTYHLYFAYLMRKSEQNYLAAKLSELSDDMLRKSTEQYQELKGTQWEEAAGKNVAFFYVGKKLLNDSEQLPVDDSTIESTCNTEYNKVMEAAGIDECLLSGLNEDYSQYKPRGYYEGDDVLEHYFRSMMWYGRIPFDLGVDDMIKSAILQTLAISEYKDKWESIYKITSFFAGASDDPGYTQLSDIVSIAYGSDVTTMDLTDEASFNKVKKAVEKLEMPSINSIPVVEGEEAVIPSYRFMGQRFTVDAAIMQKLVYRNVGANLSDEKRYLPDVLDTAAALGSESALNILKDQGDTEYAGYMDNLNEAKEHFNNDDAAIWNASLYAGWLNTLRPLFEEKKEGYPSYMYSEEWNKKNLETFAGSYAELKHDTILYAKQIMAEMGGGDMETLDDRGYVDPQPVIYSRFYFLSDKTREGLESYGMIDEDSKENLKLLSEIAMQLLKISEKELQNQPLTDEEYEFIRCYGGNLEHFWYEVNKDTISEELVYSHQAPCPTIADIATDPNGTVLEVGSGNADDVYVVFPIDGELHVGRGSVYSFYQFTRPISGRLTDSEWREMLSGGHYDDDWNFVESEGAPDKPKWTTSYRTEN